MNTLRTEEQLKEIFHNATIQAKQEGSMYLKRFQDKQGGEKYQ